MLEIVLFFNGIDTFYVGYRNIHSFLSILSDVNNIAPENPRLKRGQVKQLVEAVRSY
jgi:hypothetical protein